MATSLIKFSQGATVGTSGWAFTATAGSAVTVVNSDNTGVNSWQIELVDVPSGSSLSTGVIAHSDNGSTPTITSTPDVSGGCYRFVLKVWSAINRSGAPDDTDIRNVVVLDSRGFASPPSQVWPLPLPPTVSGLPTNKPNELNINGQERGYAGAGTDGLLDQRFNYPVVTNINVSAGTTSRNLSAFVFSNSNSVSFGLNGSTITASVSYPTQTVQTQNIAVPSAGTQTAASGTVVFSNSNGISFGMSNSSVITASYTVPTQTNQTVGLFGLGNTTQNSSTTLDARSLSFNGLGIVTVGYSNGSIQISASTAAQTVQTSNIVVPSAGTQTATSGTVVFSNSNGISFGMSGSSRITASYTVPSLAGLITGINLSAGTTSNNLSAFVFSNSNNVSFGLNGSTVTATVTVPAQTNQTEGLYAIGNTVGQSSSSTFDARTLSISGAGIASVGYSGNALIISVPSAGASINFSAGTTSNNLNAVTFNNANGVSFGLNGSVVTGSIATSLTGINLSAGTTSNNLSAFVFSNSNNVSFGLNGSTVTATVTVPAQTVQTIGLYGLGNTTQNSSTTLDARTLSFNGLGIVTVGYSNGSIQISATTAAQSNQTEGRYAIGNTVGQSSSSTFDARIMSISGAGIASVGYSGNALIISVPSAGGSINFSAGTTSNNLNAITFNNGNNVSFGLNGSTLTGSVATSLTGVNLSAGTTSNNLSAFVFSNSNNVSFGLNGSTVTATISVPAQTVQSVGLYALGNTTQNSSTTLDARTLSFNGAGIITVGYSNGSIQVSATTVAQSAQTQNIVVPTAGTQTATSGTVAFANSNGISFGMSGSSQITASYTVPTVPTQTNQTVGLYALGNTTQNSSTTLDARTLSFNGAGIVTVGYSNGTIQVSATTAAQTNQTQGLYALGNTTGQSSSSTFDARTLSISGAGIASVGYSGNALVISVPPGAPSPVNFSAGTTSGNLGSIVFSNSNGVSFGLNGSTITASAAAGQTTAGFYAVGNTTQNSSTTIPLNSISYNAVGAVTMGYSNGSIQVSAPATSSLVGVGGILVSTNGSTISVSGINIQNFEPNPLWVSNSSLFVPGVGSWYVEPFVLPENMAGGRINKLVSMAGTASILNGSSASFNSGSTGSRSAAYNFNHSVAIYSLGAGTNSTRLESIWSNTFSIGLAQSISVSLNGGTALTVTNAATMSYVASIDSIGGYTTSSLAGSTSVSTAATTMATASVTVGISSLLNKLSGQFVLPVGFNTTLAPGNYWMAHAYSTASTTGGTSVVAGSVLSLVNHVGLQAANVSAWRVWGQTVSTSGSMPFPGMGVYSAASSVPPSTIAFNDIRNVAAIRQYFNIVNSTI